MPLDPQTQAIFDGFRPPRGRLDPQAQAVFDELQGKRPSGAPRRLDPATQSVFDELSAQGRRSQPPPIVVQAPPPAPPPPVQPVAAAISRPAPAPATDPGFSWWKVVSWFDDPRVATLNKAAEAGYASEARGENPLQTAGAVFGAVGRALVPDWLAPGSPKEAQGAFWEGLMSPRPVNSTAFQRPGRENASQAEKNVRAGLDFGASIVGGAGMAKIFGGVLGALGRKGHQAAQAVGLLDAAIPGVGKSVNALKGERRLREVAKRQYVLGDAMRGIQERKADAALKQIETIYTAAQKQTGTSFAKMLPDGRRVNKADEWVTHWLEAGAPGAAHPSRHVVERLAQADGVEPAVIRQVAGLVRDRFNDMGRWLEGVGYLKPGTVAAFGDQYIARTYHFASSNLDDVEAALEAGVKGGWLTPEAEALAQKVMRQSGLGRGTGYAPKKARKDLTAAQQQGLGREYQAGVIAANALPKQAKIAARFQAVQGIADDPELFLSATTKQTKPGLSVDRLAQAEQRADQAERAYRMADTDLSFLKDALPRAPRGEREAIRLKIQLQTRKARDLKAAAARRAEDLSGAEARYARGPTQANVASGATPPPGWQKAKIGGHDGWWHPEAMKVIDNVDRFADLDQIKALRVLAKTASFIRNRWVTFNPAVQEGNLKQNIVLAEGAAAAKGVHWNGAMLAEDGAWLWKNRGDPMADPYFRELAERSRAFMGKGGILGEVGDSLRKNIGIDRPIDKAVKTAKAVNAAPGEVFSFAEQSAKYSLFKRLRKAGIDVDEAAQAVDRALFDHADQNVIAAVAQKYGFIPFFGSRLKGLENTVLIAARNPDILLRQSGLRLGQAFQQATGTEDQPLADPKTGKLRMYVPGMVDEEGRQQSLTGQIFSQNPFAPLTGANPSAADPTSLLFGGVQEMVDSPLGVWQTAANAIRNQDAFLRDSFPAGGGFIVRPGELPPIAALLKRAQYVWEGYAPGGTLTPGARGANRIDRAFAGTTQYGGLSQQPESPMDAFLGVLAGIKVTTPESAREKTFRTSRVRQDRLPNQVFLAQYRSEVRSGRVKRQTWPEHMLPKDPMQTKDWMKNALRNLNSFTLGRQEVQGSDDQKAKIRHYADWVMQLEDHLQNKFGEQLRMNELMEQSRE